MLRLTSDAFAPGQPIPREYTCEGGNVSPPLAWSGAPEGTKTFVLIVDDPDAPDPKKPKMTFVHWVLYNIPAECLALAAGAAPPAGSAVGVNDRKQKAYTGPCPPIGRHRYFHKLYALDARLPVLAEATKGQVERLMEGHILATAELMGTYQKT